MNKHEASAIIESMLTLFGKIYWHSLDSTVRANHVTQAVDGNACDPIIALIERESREIMFV